jgi:hypothetical protein
MATIPRTQRPVRYQPHVLLGDDGLAPAAMLGLRVIVAVTHDAA